MLPPHTLPYLPSSFPTFFRRSIASSYSFYAVYTLLSFILSLFLSPFTVRRVSSSYVDTLASYSTPLCVSFSPSLASHPPYCVPKNVTLRSCSTLYAAHLSLSPAHSPGLRRLQSLSCALSVTPKCSYTLPTSLYGSASHPGSLLWSTSPPVYTIRVLSEAPKWSYTLPTFSIACKL